MQVLAYFNARVTAENFESPSPEDILRVLANSVHAWKSEGQARARLKVNAATRAQPQPPEVSRRARAGADDDRRHGW